MQCKCSFLSLHKLTTCIVIENCGKKKSLLLRNERATVVVWFSEDLYTQQVLTTFYRLLLCSKAMKKLRTVADQSKVISQLVQKVIRFSAYTSKMQTQ